MTDVLVCPGCHRKLVAPIEKCVRMVCCPKCGYAWDRWDKIEMGPFNETCQRWKIEEVIRHDDVDCDDGSSTTAVDDIDLQATAATAQGVIESQDRESVQRSGPAACLSCKREFLLREDGFRLCTACARVDIPKPAASAWLETKTSIGWTIEEILDREG